MLLQPQTMCSATRTLNSTVAALVDMNLATCPLSFTVLFELLMIWVEVK